MRRSTHLAAVLALLAALCAVLLPAPSAGARESCLAGDTFDGTVAQMKHYLTYCAGVPFDVFDNTNPASPTVRSYDAHGARINYATPAAPPGGPSCEWLFSTANGLGGPTTSLVKGCYGGGVRHLICSKYFAGNFYPYHCGVMEAVQLVEAQAGADWADRVFSVKSAEACAKGVAHSLIVGVIVKTLDGPVGWGAAAVGGCLGGSIAYIFGMTNCSSP